MKRNVLVMFGFLVAVAGAAATGCGRYTKAQVIAYCTSHPKDPDCLAYCQSHPAECRPYLGGQGGMRDAGGLGGTGGSTTVTPDAAPPADVMPDFPPSGPETSTVHPDALPPLSCQAIAGYSLSGEKGCLGPYVTDTALITIQPFTDPPVVRGLDRGMFLKADNSPDIFVIGTLDGAATSVHYKIPISADKVLSWITEYGCVDPGCLAADPPSANGCSAVKQIPAAIMDLIPFLDIPVPYRAASVILVYRGPDHLMVPAESESWVVHDGDMFVTRPLSIFSPQWRPLHRIVSQEVAEMTFPRGTDALKRTIGPADMRLFGLTKPYDIDGVVHTMEIYSMCITDSDRAYAFRYLGLPPP